MLSSTIVFYIIFITYSQTDAEVFSSVADIEALIDEEANVLDILNQIKQEVHGEAQLVVQRYIQEFEVFRKNRKLVTNPVIAFKFVNHLVSNYGLLRSLLDTESLSATAAKIDFLRAHEKFPTEEDLTGIAEAFFRLQQTYRIRPKSIADGSIPGLPISKKLTAGECFVIGQKQEQLGQKNGQLQFHQSAVMWLKLARKRFHEESQDHQSVSLSKILEWLQSAAYHSGENLLKVFDITQELLNVDPDNKIGIENVYFYEQKLLDLSVEERQKLVDTYDTPDVEYVFQSNEFGEICRGDRKMIWPIPQFQKCYFETHNNPYLVLQPVKTEVAHTDPDIYILHDVITSRQIEVLKKLGREHIKRATIINPENEKGLVSDTRVSKTSFLASELDPLLTFINGFSGHISNMNSSSVEPLQINNYGIGGHYLSHYDFFRDPDHTGHHIFKPEEGDRIATLMYYLTDVEAGGATAFPKLNLTLYPEKGAAVLWFNLFRDGVGDARTLHGGCPVLSGTKWVANKWFREVGQDQFRSCGLKKDSP